MQDERVEKVIDMASSMVTTLVKDNLGVDLDPKLLGDGLRGLLHFLGVESGSIETDSREIEIVYKT